MRTEDEMVAYALEADVALLPHLPELLTDLQELGSDAEAIAEVVADLGLPSGSRVIDRGCGKGATAVEIAASLDVQVVGLELFSPFLQACRELARTNDVDGRCTFVGGDIKTKMHRVPAADVVVFAALGDVLGPLDESVRIIREYVRPGRHLVISDVYLADGAPGDFPGFEGYAEHAETVRRLTAAGDRLMCEILEDDEDSDEDDPDDEDDIDETALIAARAEALVARLPELAGPVGAFVASQAEENAFIEDNVRDAIWVLRRADD